MRSAAVAASSRVISGCSDLAFGQGNRKAALMPSGDFRSISEPSDQPYQFLFQGVSCLLKHPLPHPATEEVRTDDSWQILICVSEAYLEEVRRGLEG